MRAADADILIVPGREARPDHWQFRWARKLSTAGLVDPPPKGRVDGGEWRASLVAHAKAARRPVVFVAHDIGVIVAVQAAAFLGGIVHGAFLVAPPDPDIPEVPDETRELGPVPRDRLPFPSFLVASRTDPFCSFEFAEQLARDWRSLLLDAGEAGHLNAGSRHGPWPEGLLVFSRLLRRLSP
jgi:predicted alpha/beta hydrolase family esterase